MHAGAARDKSARSPGPRARYISYMYFCHDSPDPRFQALLAPGAKPESIGDLTSHRK